MFRRAVSHFVGGRRLFSTNLERDYNRVADRQMQHLVEELEAIVDTADSEDFDLLFNYLQPRLGRRLTLKLGTSGTFVVNKQPPNKQIMAIITTQVLSNYGPKRFDYQDGSWVNLRNNEVLDQLLSQELSTVLGRLST
ncbi:hypothetical protein BC829DRAFT_405006 [Chytridium lagenaria]|nr:hypothetical protein BC829DRAFT_405006 [Chytridium lagenaria]